MRTFTIAAIILALLSASAFAQQRGPKTTRSEEEKRNDAEVDKAYQKALKATGDKGQPVIQDPWGAVRSPPGGTDKR
jgi:hypothetical protein